MLLWVIWAATGFGFPWPIFVTVFWGIGIASQAWMIYRGAAPITEAQIEREMGRGSDVDVSPDTTTLPTIAPAPAPVDTPTESPSRPVTDDGDHDRFAHYARKDDVAACVRHRRGDRRAVRQEVDPDPRPEELPGLPDVQGAQGRRLEDLPPRCAFGPHGPEATNERCGGVRSGGRGRSPRR